MRIVLLALIAVGCSNTQITKAPASAEPTITTYTVTERNSQANTGVAYDSKRNQMLHAVYDFAISAQYIKITDTKNNYVRAIDITNTIRFAQGLAYEAQRDVIWIWGTKLDKPFQEWTDCFEIVVIDQQGQVVERIDTPLIDNYPGMIALNDDGTLWLKANTMSTARLYDRNFNLLKEVYTGVGCEGVAILGNMLVAHGDTIDRQCLITYTDISSGYRTSVESPSTYCGAEGLVFDGSGALWVTTDDGYHYSEPGRNMAWVMSNF